MYDHSNEQNVRALKTIYSIFFKRNKLTKQPGSAFQYCHLHYHNVSLQLVHKIQSLPYIYFPV